jgi:hypothetical protein
MSKRMLRAVLATAFSAALACGAFAVAGDISWSTAPGRSTTQTVQAGDISWTVTDDISWRTPTDDISWAAPTDISWGAQAHTGA